MVDLPVKLVVQVRLLPSAGQAEAVRAALHAANDAANRVPEAAHEKTVSRNFALRKHTYEDIRAAGLGSQAAQHVIRKAAGAYRALHSNIKNGNYGKPGSKRRLKAQSEPIEFRPDAAQPYDQRNLSFAPDARTISLWTLAGRLKDVPFTCPAGMLKALTKRFSSAGTAASLRTQTGMLPATSLPAQRVRGTLGGSHPSRPRETAVKT